MSKIYVRGCKVTVKIHNIVKYEDTNEAKNVVSYEDVESFEVVTGDRATEIGLTTDEASRDPLNEYFVLYFKDGSEATFRSSYCDLFID